MSEERKVRLPAIDLLRSTGILVGVAARRLHTLPLIEGESRSFWVLNRNGIIGVGVKIEREFLLRP